MNTADILALRREIERRRNTEEWGVEWSKVEALWGIKTRGTADLKSCIVCLHELREGDRYCRRCGVNQNQAFVTEMLKGLEAESKYRTSRLPQIDDYHRVSGSLMKILATNASISTSRMNNRFAKLVVSILAAFPLWLMIVLLSPFDAYSTAKSIANENRSN